MSPSNSFEREGPARISPAREDDHGVVVSNTIVRNSRSRPSNATIPPVASAGSGKTPKDTLQLPHYDKPEPTLLGIPEHVRLRILKLAFPYTICAMVSRGHSQMKHQLWRGDADFEAAYYAVPHPRDDGLRLGLVMPPFLNCSKQLYEEGSKVIKTFVVWVFDTKPANFERYPRILQKYTKTIIFNFNTIRDDHTSLFSTFVSLREIKFTMAPQSQLRTASQILTTPMNEIWLETPIPNPVESDFTERILPRFTCQGVRLLRDQFSEAVYQSNIKISFRCFLGPFKPSRTGCPHTYDKLIATAQFTWSRDGIKLQSVEHVTKSDLFERTCVEGRGELSGMPPLTSQICGSVSCKGDCAGCMQLR